MVFFCQLLYSDRSVVVSAPTGSGKTVLFELAMVRLMLCSPVPLANIKIIYSMSVACLGLMGQQGCNSSHQDHLQYVCSMSGFDGATGLQ